MFEVTTGVAADDHPGYEVDSLFDTPAHGILVPPTGAASEIRASAGAWGPPSRNRKIARQNDEIRPPDCGNPKQQRPAISSPRIRSLCECLRFYL